MRSIGGVNKTYELIFRDLFSAPILRSVIDQYSGIPKPESSAKDDLFKHILRYIERNFREEPYIKFAEFVTSSNKPRIIERDLDEPDVEEDLKPILKKTLREDLGCTPYDREVVLEPSTRADIVGYRRRYDHAERGWWVFKETQRIPYYEFTGIELKTAKRGKDAVFRQAPIYTDYFDYTYTVITPLMVLKHGYQKIDRFYKQMKTAGVGILLANAHRTLGSIIEAKEKRPKEKNRKYLTDKLELNE